MTSQNLTVIGKVRGKKHRIGRSICCTMIKLEKLCCHLTCQLVDCIIINLMEIYGFEYGLFLLILCLYVGTNFAYEISVLINCILITFGSICIFRVALAPYRTSSLLTVLKKRVQTALNKFFVTVKDTVENSERSELENRFTIRDMVLIA